MCNLNIFLTHSPLYFQRITESDYLAEIARPVTERQEGSTLICFEPLVTRLPHQKFWFLVLGSGVTNADLNDCACLCVSHQASGSRMVYSCGEVVSGKLWRTASRCWRSSAPWYVNRMSRACTLLSCRQTNARSNNWILLIKSILNCTKHLHIAWLRY